MKELEDFGRLLNAVYDAPLDNGRWPILSRQIADTFGTHSCALQVRTNGNTVVLGCTENFTPSLVRDYQNYYHRTDDRATGAIARGLNRAYVGTELIDNDLLTRTEHFDFLGKADIFFVVGGGVAVSTHEIGLIGVQAGRNAANSTTMTGARWHCCCRTCSARSSCVPRSGAIRSSATWRKSPWTGWPLQ